MKPLKKISILGYGAGDAANNLAFTTATMFLLVYYTDVEGISATAAGTLLLVVQIFDAFADTFARSHGRQGLLQAVGQVPGRSSCSARCRCCFDLCGLPRAWWLERQCVVGLRLHFLRGTGVGLQPGEHPLWFTGRGHDGRIPRNVPNWAVPERWVPCWLVPCLASLLHP